MLYLPMLQSPTKFEAAERDDSWLVASQGVVKNKIIVVLRILL